MNIHNFMLVRGYIIQVFSWNKTIIHISTIKPIVQNLSWKLLIKLPNCSFTSLGILFTVEKYNANKSWGCFSASNYNIKLIFHVMFLQSGSKISFLQIL